MKTGVTKISKKRHQLPLLNRHRPQQNSASPLLSAAPALRHTVTFPTDFVWVNTVRTFIRKHQLMARFGAIWLALLIITEIFISIQTPRISNTRYDIAAYQGNLIDKSVSLYADKLVFNQKDQTYQYNQDYNPANEGVSGQLFSPKFTASFDTKNSKAITLTDSVNKVSLTLTPKFGLDDPKKDMNHLVYPMTSMNANVVYTARAGSVKEDIILKSYAVDDFTLKYDVKTDSGTELRAEKDGSLAVYGAASTILGNVTTSNEKDALLLQKVRAKAPKTQLLFTIPAPFVKQQNNKVSPAKVAYELKNGVLSLHVSNLKNATYPLSVDPSVYIESATKLMRGNNESNISFDVSNELIQKAQTTGARIDAWTSTNNLSNAVWGQGTAVMGGFIYSVGGQQGNSTSTTPYYTAGTSTYTVPTGITSITVQAWGAGGGGGAGNGGSGRGGNGGGGGYAKAVITVTPGESLDVTVGSAGNNGTGNGNGGDGGGFSAVQRSGTYLVQAGGGGGGGGARGTGNGGAGGVGGGSTGTAGGGGTGSATPGGGGGGGTTTTGGAGGSAGSTGTAGNSGAANTGGNGGGYTSNTCNSAVTTRGNGGTYGSAGAGGNDNSTCGDGGGGGGGRFGGGGGGSVGFNNRGAGGGGGGSDLVTGTSTVQTQGSGTNPGNSGDANNNGAGFAGTGGTNAAGASAGADGAVVISYTTTGSGVTNQVAWAKFNPTTNAIESPNPGQGSCVGWCTDSVYNLPTALTNLSLVAYNGFLYALGGQTSIGGTPQTYVYIAKIGANGEPQLWHPSGGTPTYWYQDTALSAARSMFGAVAYNNRLYILGGLTTSTTVLSSNTVQYANINPTGTLTTWTSTGMQALSPARYGLSAQVYNDTLYVIGGDTSFTGTPITTVEYSKLNNDGTMNTWVTASSLQTSGRLTIGGSFSTIWAGYIYVAGGCTAVDSNGYCTTMASDVQLASINADGSLAEWNTILGLTNQRVGHTLIAWQGGLYRLGGCRTQDTGTGDCSNTVLDVDYGVINQEGEASTVADSSASGTAPCSGGNPYDCDLPGTSIIGNVLTGSAIMNGYLYIWGGCKNTNAGCTSTSQGVMYTSIGSDGTLTKPASCGSWSSVDSYCYNTTSLPGEVGAPGVAVFNGFIYSVGGFTSGSTVGNIYYAQPSLTDGSISSWSSTTLASLGGVSTTVKYPYSFARANPASAGTSPGNLYILGGCTGSTGIGCGTYTKGVYKCNISTAGVPSSCSATGQMQLDQNIGAMAGTVYANYLYIIGGLATGGDLQTTRYAKVDNSNNIVDASTGLSTGNWTVSGNQMYYARRRGSGFGYNGFLYVVGGYDGTGGGGILADIEFTKINVSDGSLGTWQISSVNIQQRWGLALTVSNSYAYVIGGCIAGNAPTCNAGGQTNSVQTFQIYNNDSGAVQAYNSSANNFATSTDRWGASATVLNGYLYVAGGCTSATDCTATTSNVQKALISTSDGSIGTWSSTTSALPAVRAWGKLVNAGGYLYYLGGQDNTPTNQSTVYYAQPGGTGDVTSWSTATKGIGDTGSGGQARTKFGAAVWDDRIYVIGGLDGSSTVSSTVYYSPKLSSGGNITSNWTASNAFNVARYGGATTAYANNIYLFGGIDSGGNYLNDAQFATIGYRTGSLSQSGTTVSGAGGATWTSAMVGSTIQYADGSKSTIVSFTNSTTLTVDASKTVAAGTLYTIQDGSVNNWNYTTSIPGKIAQSEAFGANGYIYLVGGRSATSTCTPKTLVAPVSANTTIASGNNPTGVGTWFETNVRYSGDRYGAAVAYNGGKLYLMGGGCTAPLSSNRNYYATLKSQPQVAKYSRMIDTDSDVFPTKWLLNGLDNSIGARWNLKYRSMTNTTTSCTTPAMTTWGQETNYGPVSLGTAGTYTPLDGSGVNTNCARFFYLSVSIDASQTYGYPEDVQRGPTITDLSLFFTADPSKRLIHGKTFVDGQQQPLDTPF